MSRLLLRVTSLSDLRDGSWALTVVIRSETMRSILVQVFACVVKDEVSRK